MNGNESEYILQNFYTGKVQKNLRKAKKKIKLMIRKWRLRLFAKLKKEGKPVKLYNCRKGY